MSDIEKAQLDFEKKDRRFRIGLGVMAGYALILLTILAVQTFIIQSQIAENQKKNVAASEERFRRYTEDNAVQHKLTQDFIRCIASALLVPVSLREESSFDQCGIEAKNNPSVSNAPLDMPGPIITTSPFQPNQQSTQPSGEQNQPDTQPSQHTVNRLLGAF